MIDLPEVENHGEPIAKISTKNGLLHVCYMLLLPGPLVSPDADVEITTI